MKTSTLRRLPMPFVVACLLGIGVLSFLLLRPASEVQESAKNGESSAQTDARLPADSSRYRVKKSGVAKLNRSAGATAHPAKQSQSKPQSIANAQSQPAKPAAVIASDIAKADTTEAPKQTRPASKRAPQQIADRSPETKSTGGSDSRLEAAVASMRAPTALRRDVARVKSAKVATTTKPASSDAYSPENPDPSDLLSQVLDSNTRSEAQLTINDPSDVVMPPSVQLTEGDLVAPKSDAVDLATNAGTPDQGSATRTTAADNTKASSVVTGQLMTESNPPAPTKTVRIINPASNPLPVWFVTQKQKIQLKPGQLYESATEEQLLVRFARGGNLGVDRVATKSGDWVFSVTRQEGWKLTQN